MVVFPNHVVKFLFTLSAIGSRSRALLRFRQSAPRARSFGPLMFPRHVQRGVRRVAVGLGTGGRALGRDAGVGVGVVGVVDVNDAPHTSKSFTKCDVRFSQHTTQTRGFASPSDATQKERPGDDTGTATTGLATRDATAKRGTAGGPRCDARGSGKGTGGSSGETAIAEVTGVAEAHGDSTEARGDATEADGDSISSDADTDTDAASSLLKSTTTPPRSPLDGTSTETDGVRNHRVVQNTWWEALTLTPVYALRATNAKWVQARAIKKAIDQEFDPDVFSKQAASARDEVLKAYAANDMNRVRAMCTPNVFAAFQESRIEYTKNNLSLTYDGRDVGVSDDDSNDFDDSNDSDDSTHETHQDSLLCTAKLIDLRLARGEADGNSGTRLDDPEDDLSWQTQLTRCRSYVDDAASGKRGDVSADRFDSTALDEADGGSDGDSKTIVTAQTVANKNNLPLRLVATVFVMDHSGVKWRIEDTVSGTVGTTEDLRIQEWSFTRDLPARWPASADEMETAPWRVEHVA